MVFANKEDLLKSLGLNSTLLGGLNYVPQKNWSERAAIIVNGFRKQRGLIKIIRFEFYFTGGVELCTSKNL